MTPMGWNIFGPLPEFTSGLSAITTSTATKAVSSSTVVEDIPWACKHTLRDLQLNLDYWGITGIVDVARRRLQSFTNLQELSLSCDALPLSVLLDPEQSLEGPSLSLYPSLENLAFGTINMPLSSENRAKLMRSMPRLKHAEHLMNDERPNPFQIPELCHSIASYFGQADFAQLSRVCKGFSQLFQPYVWSNVVLNGYTSYRDRRLPRIKALKSKGRLVKHAELSSWDVELRSPTIENDYYLLASTLLAQCGSNLTLLKIVDCSSNGRIWDALLERIIDNRTLEGARILNNIRVLEITLTFEVFESNFLPLLTQHEGDPEVMVVFAKVMELRLGGRMLPVHIAEGRARKAGRSFDRMGPITIRFRDLIRVFPGLYRLSLDYINIDRSEDEVRTQPSELEAVTTPHPGYCRFHTLDFEDCSISSKQIVHILRRSRNVRSLKLGRGTFAMGQTDMLINHLPELAPELTEYEQDGMHFSGLSIMFRGLSHLTRLRISGCLQVQDDELRILAESCPSLQHLTLHHCQSMTYRGLQHILRSSTRLRSLRMAMTFMPWDLFGPDPVELLISDQSSATAARSASPAAVVPWACQDTLQHLNLFMLVPDNLMLVDAARRRLQSLTNLRWLDLVCENLPISVLLDPIDDADTSSGAPSSSYPALETLVALGFSPNISLKETRRIVKSMPRLMQVVDVSFDYPSRA
ncbi:hypothetical protein BGZ72_003773 [Mortierella alpina]|nr:hypothetical protein BGZ72_003773 [Mortierella alpina]